MSKVSYFEYFFIPFYFQLVNTAVKEKIFSMRILLCICKVVMECMYSCMRDKGVGGQGYEVISSIVYQM